jgi:pSer/pThr/pTyr-binding forkhead associated (FHA) protein
MRSHIHRCPEPSCSFFNQVLPHNAKVCPMCGTPLEQAVQAPSIVHGSQSLTPSSNTFAELNGELRPHLKLLHPSGQSFLLIKESGAIGRQTQANGIRPDIDLTGIPHADVVSRVHAHLYWDSTQETYMIIDDSRNGSYLNGKLLARGAPHPLQKGDELQLGQDRLIFFQVELSHTVNQSP